MSSPIQENNEPKAEFRKLTNEAANRKYRRHSPAAGSSDERGSPKRDHGLREISKVSDYERRKDDRNSGRNQHGRSSDSYRHSSRGNRHDEDSRYKKYADDDDRSHAKSSSRAGRESKGGTHSDYRDRESDYNRSRDRYRDVTRHSQDKSDVADRKYKDKDLSSDRRHRSQYDDWDRHAKDRDHRDERRDHRSPRDHRSERTTAYEHSPGHRSDSNLKREIGDLKGLDGSKYREEGKNINEKLDRHEDRRSRAGGKSETLTREDFDAKRPKFSSKDNDSGKDASQTVGSKQGEELAAEETPEQAPVNVSDSAANVDAAKVAAMKAAQLVNQNLTSTGFMTADQKKKLLWGNKKSNSTEESSHHWDAALFSDRERQEKFNKLMGVKGEVKADSRPPSSQDAEKQRELQQDLEKQYTAGLRRRDGRTVGLGL